MGIVIINGKRYDSVTGLMINDTTDSVAIHNTEKIENSFSNEMPSWVSSYVGESEQSAANHTAESNAASHLAKMATTPNQLPSNILSQPPSQASKPRLKPKSKLTKLPTSYHC